MRRIGERYATATQSGNMAMRGDRCDAAILAAAGMAGIANTWASSAYRLKYANDAAEYRVVIAGLKRAARRLARKRQWGLPDAQLAPLLRHVLGYWIADTCPACLGRGAQTIAGTPILEQSLCEACSGTGRRRLHLDGGDEGRARDILALLDAAVAGAADRMVAKLG